MPVKVTEQNAHRWLPCELIARENELRREELGSKYASVARQSETRLVRVLLMAQTVALS